MSAFDINYSPRSWQDSGVVATSASPHCRLHDVPLRAVRLGDGLWKPRVTANLRASIPKLLELLEEHGVVDNFRRLSGRKYLDRRGPLFTDSDLYKWMEAAALALQTEDSPVVRQALDSVIDDVLAAQAADGYLNTYFSDAPYSEHKRFSNLDNGHELYCAGHLFQAAIAHHRATGETKLLNGARRFADYLVHTFGPGKLEATDGHPEIEMALVELCRTTGERSYLDLAGFLLDQPQCHLGNLAFRQKTEITGHAVRAGYLCAGAADYYAETGDREMLEAAERQWQDMVSGKVYITGSIGSRYAGEAFGASYELPNARAYAETCAAIANAMWNWRMLMLSGEARFADMVETVLYNGFLSGVSLDGCNYFYMNPLECPGSYQRAPWHGCTCCPPNVQRTLATMPGWMFSTSAEGLWVHLYGNCRLDWRLDNGQRVALEAKTTYPWEGAVTVEVSPEEPMEFTLFLRIPGWCREAEVWANGETTSASPGYVPLKRRWHPGDIVRLELPMPVELVLANDRVRENVGCVALRRGPVVYCFESPDNPDVSILDLKLLLDPSAPARGFTPEHCPDLLGGVTVLRGQALTPKPGHAPGPLYEPPDQRREAPAEQATVTAIPYHAWANRGPSQMRVWVPWAAQ